jgi:hypothetical protein
MLGGWDESDRLVSVNPNVAYFFEVAAGFSLRITQPKGCDYLDPRIHPR